MSASVSSPRTSDLGSATLVVETGLNPDKNFPNRVVKVLGYVAGSNRGGVCIILVDLGFGRISWEAGIGGWTVAINPITSLLSTVVRGLVFAARSWPPSCREGWILLFYVPQRQVFYCFDCLSGRGFILGFSFLLFYFISTRFEL